MEDIIHECNFYKLFDVPDNATNDQIIKKYKVLVSIYHSDKTGNSDNSLKLINHAKDVLLDPRKRASHNSFINSIKNNNSSQNSSNTDKSLNNRINILLADNDRLKNNILILEQKLKTLAQNNSTKINNVLITNKILNNTIQKIESDNKILLEENRALEKKYIAANTRKLTNAGCALILASIGFITLGCLWIILKQGLLLSGTVILAGVAILCIALHKR